MGEEPDATPISVKIETAVTLRQITLSGAALMPLMLTDAERAMLDSLAAPIDAHRRPEFMGAVEKELAAASPAAIGPGTVHRTAREVLGQFWTAPQDLRQGRVGPRNPRNA